MIDFFPNLWYYNYRKDERKCFMNDLIIILISLIISVPCAIVGSFIGLSISKRIWK